MEDLNRRVDRGARFLDLKIPGWHDKIDLSKLRMESPCGCVLGQLFEGHYGEGVIELDLLTKDEAVVCGFNLPGNEYTTTRGWGERWALLDRAWKIEVARRRHPSAS